MLGQYATGNIQQPAHDHPQATGDSRLPDEPRHVAALDMLSPGSWAAKFQPRSRTGFTVPGPGARDGAAVAVRQGCFTSGRKLSIRETAVVSGWTRMTTPRAPAHLSPGASLPLPRCQSFRQDPPAFADEVRSELFRGASIISTRSSPPNDVQTPSLRKSPRDGIHDSDV